MNVNFSQARYNMVEQQVRPWQVLNSAVLEVMMDTPREHFVPPAYRGVAYADIPVPLGHGEFMLPPVVEGRMIQSLLLEQTDKVLEIGTGSGYTAALLAKSAAQVYSLDIEASATRDARSKLTVLGLNNVEFITADGLQGWEEQSRYDAIAVTGSLPEYVPVFQEQLKIGGRLFVIVGEAPVMKAMLITRLADQEWREEWLFETDIPALRGASKKSIFDF